MTGLFPAIKPYAKHHLQVDDIHNIYIEEVGVPDGIPLLFLHDGPGKGTLPEDSRLFDPQKYRIILFDQRGCGRSTPYASVLNNTTDDLLNDISKILKLLKIKQCVLFGEGWGATLALLYAMKYTEQVQGILLHSLFLAQHSDLQWLFSEQGGGAKLFPEHFESFASPASRHDMDSILSTYSQLLVSDNELEKMVSAKTWLEWQAQIGNPHPEFRHKIDLVDADIALCMSLIQCHYFSRDCFLPDGYINQNVLTLIDLPILFIHGRFDIAYPLAPAYQLYQQLPLAQLFIVPYAGHFDCEPVMIAALCRATNLMSEILDYQQA